MPSHIHTFKPGSNVTLAADADITGGRLVEITGPRRVATAAAGSVKVFGAAATDVKAGDDVLILRGGVQELVSAGAITAGTRVKAAAGGKVSAVGADETGNGLAITSTSAADQPIDIALD